MDLTTTLIVGLIALVLLVVVVVVGSVLLVAGILGFVGLVKLMTELDPDEAFFVIMFFIVFPPGLVVLIPYGARVISGGD